MGACCPIAGRNGIDEIQQKRRIQVRAANL
jgi:hypothetical protein